MTLAGLQVALRRLVQARRISPAQARAFYGRTLQSLQKAHAPPVKPPPAPSPLQQVQAVAQQAEQLYSAVSGAVEQVGAAAEYVAPALASVAPILSAIPVIAAPAVIIASLLTAQSEADKFRAAEAIAETGSVLDAAGRKPGGVVSVEQLPVPPRPVYGGRSRVVLEV